MSAHKGNTYAQKGQELATSHLHIRVMPRDKARWVRTANLRRQKLAEWVVEKLNAASGQ